VDPEVVEGRVKPGIVAASSPPPPAIVARALGIDPGPTRTAVAVVVVDASGRFAIELGMHVMSHDPWLRAVMRDVARRGGTAAQEGLVGYAYEAKRVQALVETARAEGRFLEAAAAAELPITEIGAREWRGELCRAENASDEQIRIVVEGLCVTRPTLRADARAHVYDAAGVAIVHLARRFRRRIALPSRVEIALARQQAADKHSRTVKRADTIARAAAGLPPAGEKRSITRAQSKRRSDAQKRRAR
jgi:Holliday junction resolvasome RuvABC endonuclease subunit